MLVASTHNNLLDSKIENHKGLIERRVNQMSEIVKRESEHNPAWVTLLKKKCETLKKKSTDLDTVAAEFTELFERLDEDE